MTLTDGVIYSEGFNRDTFVRTPDSLPRVPTRSTPSSGKARLAVILLPAPSAEDWRTHLTDPIKHWVTGFSAKTLAYCWQEACGFPGSVTGRDPAAREAGTAS